MSFDHARLINIGQGSQGKSMTMIFEVDEPVLWFFSKRKTFQVIGDGFNWRFVGGRPCTGEFRERLCSIWAGMQGKRDHEQKDQVERFNRV